MKPDTANESSTVLQHREQQLEQLITQACQAQPALHAPEHLQAKIMTAVRRRASLRWWHLSFVDWPLPVRVMFLALSLGIVKLTLAGLMRLNEQTYATQLVDTVTKPVSWLQSVDSLISLLIRSVELAVGGIPELWLQIGLLSVGISLAAFFGLSAIAYRTLYANR